MTTNLDNAARSPEDRLEPQKDPVFICIESRKGGVGKTTVALALANSLCERHHYEVLLLDLDLTGTDVSVAVDNSYWKRNFHPVTFTPRNNADEPGIANLIELFNLYMCGWDLPRIAWGTNGPSKIPFSLDFFPGKVNVLPSFMGTSDNQQEKRYSPNVLFDEMHSIWFIEMLHDLVQDVARGLSVTKSSKPIAVVFDNSPGYTGIQPSLEQWLTDQGPIHAKFLFVSSADTQDLISNADSIGRIEDIIETKTSGARAFADCQREPGSFTIAENSREAAFFLRLAETVPDSAPCLPWLKYRQKFEFPEAECRTQCGSRCGFEHHIREARTRTRPDKDSSSYLGIIFNRVPVIAGKTADEICQQALSATNRSELLDAVPSFAMPYDQMIAAGFLLSTLEELSSRRGSQQTVSPVTGDSVQLAASVAELLMGKNISADKVIIVVFQWHAYLHEVIRSVARTDDALDVIWFDDLSPVVSLVGLIPAIMSRAKAAKLALFSEEARSGGAFQNMRLVRDALNRLRKFEPSTAKAINGWLVSLRESERLIAAPAVPFLLAACAVNGALSGTPQESESQIASNLARLAALAQLRFPEFPPTADACKHWLRSLPPERGNERTDREEELMAAALRILGKNRIKPTATFDEFREGFCRWLVRIHGFPETVRLLSECRRAVSTGGSVELVRNAVIREVFRQIVVSGQLSAERGVEFIQQAFTAADSKELLKSWDKFAALTQLTEGISGIVAKWGLKNDAK